MRRGWSRLAVVVIAVSMVAVGARAHGQAPAPSPLRFEGLVPAGARNSVTESWGTLQFAVSNPSPVTRDARVVVFYPEQPDVQYAREVRVPAGTRVTGWLPVGPAPAQASRDGRAIEYLLFEKTGAGYVPLPPPADTRLRSRLVMYRKREPTTALIVDDVVGDELSDAVDRPDSAAAESLLLVRAFRRARGLSDLVSVVTDRFLPPTPEAFAGVDQLVLAGNRLAADPVGARAVRHWVQQGGTLWVLLDRVDPAVVGAILGDDFGLQVVDRTSLTTLRLGRAGEPAREAARQFDKPVDLVRVLPGRAATVLFEADGWPAAFARPVGQGRVVFTTLGGDGWFRRQKPTPPYDRSSELPLPVQALELLAVDVYPEPESGGWKPDDLGPLLTADIGYRVIGRGTAAAVLGGFVAVLLAGGLALRRSRHPALLAWLGPVAAVASAGVLVALGIGSREAVPPTTGAAAVTVVAPGSREGAADGLFAVYRPESGPVAVAATGGGMLDLDPAGLDTQARRRVQTDIDAWHWENVSLPAGVRVGPFRATVPTGPVAAVARFGPDGLEGRFSPGAYRDPGDTVILTAGRGRFAVRFGADGTFAVGSGDLLPAGQYGGGTVLTDRQQRRQEVYARLLSPAVPKAFAGRDLLFAWADPPGSPFSAGADRTVGTALIAVPLALVPPAAGGRVTVPRGFMPYSAIALGHATRPSLEGSSPADMRLRFQLPPSVLPLTVERAVLVTAVRAPSRTVSFSGYAGDRPARLRAVESPFEPVRVEITDPDLLRPDAGGGLHVGVAVGDRTGPGGDGGGGPDARWRIESLSLEVTGRAADR